MPLGPDFISLQVRDLDTAAAFYEERLGLRRAPASPPGAAVFASEPIPFAVPGRSFTASHDTTVASAVRRTCHSICVAGATRRGPPAITACCALRAVRSVAAISSFDQSPRPSPTA